MLVPASSCDLRAIRSGCFQIVFSYDDHDSSMWLSFPLMRGGSFFFFFLHEVFISSALSWSRAQLQHLAPPPPLLRRTNRDYRRLTSGGGQSRTKGIFVTILLPARTSNQAGITEFASPGIYEKKPAALNCRLLSSSGHLLAFHASWYYRLFIQPLFKIRVALDLCTAKKNKNIKKS